MALALVKSWLTSLRAELNGLGRAFVSSLLDDSTLPYKANLLTRVRDMDELSAELEQAVYVDVPNPLRRPLRALARELDVA
jgi:siderophore synthetase component